MLRELSIRNFAIIDDLHICFSNGLTILSGETGAGKSIIINAVNLLLGSRADTSLVRTGAESAELEALFEITPGTKPAEILYEHNFDISEGLVIRRIISRNDRHRIYLNGHIATLQLLNSITENLASISGQHAHQLLLKEDQHLMVLDQFGGLMPLREKVQKCFHQMMPLVQELNGLKELQKRQAEYISTLEFQRTEIEDACVSPGEDLILERDLVLLRNSETLFRAVFSCIEELYNARNAIVERLGQVKKNLERACRIDPDLSPKAEGIMDATFQIEDVTEGLRTYLEKIQVDEKRLEEAETRLDTLKKLKRKYGESLESVISHLESVNHDLSEIESLTDKIADVETKLSGLNIKLSDLAMQLSDKRGEAAEILAGKVVEELYSLKMSHTKFQVSLREIPVGDNSEPHLTMGNRAISETGTDRASFLIAPNVGEALKPLATIASGGELSRVVLALKAILAETESVETVIFDEVDSGIGGSVAEVVGSKLFSLARFHQVICITHLPQIAKFGDHHFKISKQVFSGRTRTIINPLDKKDRIKEIARMLGGIKMTQTTLDHAMEMLQKINGEW